VINIRRVPHGRHDQLRALLHWQNLEINAALRVWALDAQFAPSAELRHRFVQNKCTAKRLAHQLAE